MGWAWCLAAFAGVQLGAPPPEAAPRPAARSADGWGSVHPRRSTEPAFATHDEEWDTPNAPVPLRRRDDEIPPRPASRTRPDPKPLRPAADQDDEAAAPVAARSALPDPPDPEPAPSLPPLHPTAQKKAAAADDDRLPPLPTLPRPKEGLPRFDPTAPAAGKKAASAEPDPEQEPVRKKAPPADDLPPLPAPTGPLKITGEPAAKQPEPERELQTIPTDKPKASAEKTPSEAPKKTPAAETPKPAEEPAPAPAATAPVEPLPNPNVRAWHTEPARLSALWPDDDLREWSGTFRALSVFRGQASRLLATTPTRSFGTGDFAGDGAFGAEIAIERRYDAVNAFEARGMFADRLGQNLAVPGSAALPATGPNAAAFQNLSGMNWAFSNRLWDAALEWSQRYGADTCQPWRVKFLVGPRFLGVSETLGMNATAPGGAAAYFGRAENALFGANAGAVLAFRPGNSPIALEFGGRIGAFGNVLRADQTLASGAFARDDRVNTSRFASLAQLDATADLCVTEGCHLFVGYRLQSLRGVARAADQPTFNTDPAAAFNLRGDGGLLVNSIVAGLRFQWGGATDPDTRAGDRRPYLVEPR